MGTSDFLLIPNGRAAVFRRSLFCGHAGRRWAVRRIYRPLRENRSACRRGAFWTFFLPVEPDSGCRLCSFRGAEPAPGCACDGCRAPAGCTATSARSDALRGIGARAFSPAGLCAMIPPGGYGDAGRGLYIKEAATLPFRNVAAVWALRPVVCLSLSVRSRRCPAGCCCVRRRRRYSN